jgi:beta-glucanase (GH16 family)
MRKARSHLPTLIAAVGMSVTPVSTDHAAEPSQGEWKQVWSDEFDGESIDRSKWDFDLGNGFYNYDANTWISGWGNGELQYYTCEGENVAVKEGMLHIRAVKESFNGCGYTSARLKTRRRDGEALFAKKYGKFEFRVKLPTGKGIWPALWMLPQDETYGTWAASGEIDVLETKGHEPNKVFGTLHFGSRWPENAHASHETTLPGKETIADFHTYAVEWLPGEIRWSVDGRIYATQRFWWSSSKTDGQKGTRPANEADLNGWPAPFDQPFHLVMNVAVGGQFSGNPDKTTVFPAEMIVDYVRVYDKADAFGEPKPRGEGKLPFAKP